MRYFITLITFLFSYSLAFAGGFQIPEQGAKAMGMANAFTAIADDASAVWFNPAGMAFAKGTQVMAGGVLVIPNVKHTSTANVNTSATNDSVVVPHFYASHAMENSGLAFGLGINAPFGLKMEWPTTAPFKTNALLGNLEMINFNPNVAYKITDQLAIAVGVDYAYLQRVDFDASILKQNFNGSAWGYNAALLYKGDVVNVGLSYRSSVKSDATGTSSTAAPLPVGTASNSISVTMPDMLNVGIAFLPSEDWTVSLEADWVNWKKFDQLAFKYSSSLPVVGTTKTVPENWKATTAFKLGVEWKTSPNMRLRAGYAFDPTPIKDVDFTPLLPGNDRQALSLGFGYDLNDHATIDLAYTYVLVNERNQVASTGTNASRNGKYKVNIHLLGTSVSYKF
ncbi:MAG: OmpP1/FadL family transporter [Mariprofundaceae bacterium]